MEDYIKEALEELKNDYTFIKEETDITEMLEELSVSFGLNLCNKNYLKNFISEYGWIIIGQKTLFFKTKDNKIMMQEVVKKDNKTIDKIEKEIVENIDKFKKENNRLPNPEEIFELSINTDLIEKYFQENPEKLELVKVEKTEDNGLSMEFKRGK